MSEIYCIELLIVLYSCILIYSKVFSTCYEILCHGDCGREHGILFTAGEKQYVIWNNQKNYCFVYTDLQPCGQ
jgi:hypothetical protein